MLRPFFLKVSSLAGAEKAEDKGKIVVDTNGTSSVDGLSKSIVINVLNNNGYGGGSEASSSSEEEEVIEKEKNVIIIKKEYETEGPYPGKKGRLLQG